LTESREQRPLQWDIQKKSLARGRRVPTSSFEENPEDSGLGFISALLSANHAAGLEQDEGAFSAYEGG